MNPEINPTAATAGISANVYHWEPYRTVTALEILQIDLNVFHNVGVLYGYADSLKNPDELHWETARQDLKRLLNVFSFEFHIIGFKFARVQATRILALLDQPGTTAKSVIPLIKELCHRVEDHLRLQVAYVIPSQQQELYDHPLAGWEGVVEKFPTITDHIEEASRCLALGRDTACVYHLMGVVQEAIESLGRTLNITLDPCGDSWNGILEKIEKAIKDKQTSTPKPDWKPIEPFYAELVSDIKAVKNAWRNPTMHFRRTYTEDQAKKVYARVKDFMVHASAQISGLTA